MLASLAMLNETFFCDFQTLCTTILDLEKQYKKKQLRIAKVKDDIKCLKLDIKIQKLEQDVQDNKIKIQEAERNRNFLLSLADTRQWNKCQRSG